MKNKYFVLSLLLICSLALCARTYETGEKVYINAVQSDGLGDWSKDGATLFLYFYQSTNTDNNEWATLSRVGGTDVFECTLAPNYNWYDRVIVIRKSSSGTAYNWNDRLNQSCNIIIPDNSGGYNGNYLSEFYKKANVEDNCGSDQSYTWLIYAPPASTIPSAAAIEGSGVSMEHIQICPSALNGPFSLRAKLNDAKTEYVYSNVQGHGWYISTDGNTWAEVQAGKTGVAAGDLDSEIDFNTNQLPAGPLTDIYYYLHSNIAAGRRLIHITVDAPHCGLDCAITSFETAVSNVNADANTYTLDGIVAFGEPNGNLVVSCAGHTVTIPSPQSPQAFSLTGLAAASTGGQTTTVQAYFDGDPTLCHQEITIDVPNVVEIVDTIKVDVLTGNEVELKSPSAEPDNYFVWVDENDIEYDSDSRPDQTWTIPTSRFSTDEIVTYTYREYYNLDGNMDDLMANGNYEGAFDYGSYGNVSTISDYNFWGNFPQTASSQINFYDNDASDVNPSKLKDNGFAVVQNAHNFYPTYAAVTAREGSNFALFDAMTGTEGGNKKAWYATSGGNANLKLKKGTRYVLSFWAANINNYGEMDNAARFKFYIEDVSDPLNPVRIDSSKVLDLSIPEFRNNIWHQCSETFYVNKSYNNVRISVVNLNTNTLNVGNDFALDDIQFHAISTVTRAVKSYQVFKVYAHEPKVDAFTATVVPLPCNGGPAYTVQMHVRFQNPKGRLIIRDETTGTEYPYTVTASWDTPTDLNEDIVINTNEASHSWTAYFENWPSAAKTTTTDIPGFPKMTIKNPALSTPGCTDITANITFDVDYTYQQGQLHYWVDQLTDSVKTIVAKDKNEQSLTGLVYDGFNADGRTHKLHVKFDGVNSCEDSIVFTAPFSPVLDQVQIVSTVPSMLTCSTPSYTVDVEVTTHFNSAGLGKNITLHYHNGVALKDTTVEATGKKTRIDNIPLFNMDDTVGFQKIYAELDGYTPVCPDSAAYKAPKLARIHTFDVNVGETACGVMNYTISGTVSFDMTDGDLIVEYDATHRDVITPAAGSHSANFTISGMTAAGTGLTLKAWFTGSANTDCTVTSNPFDAPVIPTMAINNVTPAVADCNLTTGVTFDVDYTYQQGELRYWVDNMAHAATAIIAKSATALNSGTLSFAGFNADGKQHMLHVLFSGANSCEDSVPFTAALSQVISSVAVSGVPATILCDETTYTANVAVSMPFDATGKSIVFSYEGKDTTVAVAGNPTVAILPMTTTDASGLTVSAAFSDAPACATVSNTYTAPARLSCNKDYATVCEGESYTWPFNGTTYGPFMTVGTDTVTNAANIHDTLIVTVRPQPEISLIPIDTLYEDATEIRLPYTITKGTPNLFRISVIAGDTVTMARSTVDTLVMTKPAGVTTGDYTATVVVRDSTLKCFTTETLVFHVAGVPTVSSITITPREVECDAASYVADVHIEYMNPRGNVIVEDKTNSNSYSYPVPKAAYNTPQTLDTVVAIAAMTPAALNWEASFTGWTGATTASAAPTVPAMTINNVTPAAADCNLTTSVSFDVDYTYQQGELRYWVDNMAHAATAITAKSAAALNSGTLTFAGFNADGKQHMLHVLFSGTNSCEDSIPFTAALSQVISSVAVSGVPASILCEETTYTANVAVSMPFDATGKSIVLSYEGKDTTVAVAGNPTVAILPMTTTDASGLTVSAAFSDAPACATVSNTYNAPTRLSCTKDYATVCEGESYTWPYNGTTYGPFMTVGTDTVTNAANIHDTLIVTVRPQPEISLIPIDTLYEDATEIRLPYTVSKGTPNLFRISVIAGDTVTMARSTVDTLVMAKPAGVTTGDYTATVVVRDSTLKCFTTETLVFHVAGVPTVSSITVTPREVECDAASYVADVHIEYMNPRGNVIVEDKTNSNSYSYPVPKAAYNTPQTLDTVVAIAAMTPAALNWEASFTGWTGANATSTAPTVPTMAINNVTPAVADCNLTTGVTFDVDYTYQQGELRYWVDNMAHAATAITAKSAAALNSGTLSFAGFNADGKQHMLHVLFSGANSCEDSVAFTAALSQVISSVAVSGVPASILCDETTYNANVAVNMPYDATGKNIVLSYEGKDTTVAVSGNPTNVILPMTTTDASGLTVSATFSDAPACATVSNTYTAPARLSCNKDYATVCEGESYTWPFNGTTYGPFMTVGKDTVTNAANIHDTLIVTVRPQPEISLMAIDTLYQDATEIRLPYTITKGTPNLFRISVIAGDTVTMARSTVDTLVMAKPAGLTTGDYTATVIVRDSTLKCFTTETLVFHVAGVPTVSSITVTPREVECDAASYVADVHIEYMNPRGNVIVEDKTNSNSYSYPVPNAAYNTPQTLDTVIAIAAMTPAALNWEAYFTGWTGATTTSAAPTVPGMSINNVTPAAADCNLTTGVTFNVDYTYQQGELRYWVDNMAHAATAITAKSAAALNSGTLSFAGFNADGKQHMLHVQFSGANSCEDSVPFTAALSQVISSVAVSGVPATILCDETTYNANVAVNMPYDATGKNIVLSYEGKDTTVAVSGNPTVAILPMTTADASGLTVSATFSDAPACATVSNTYNAPARLSCNKDYATVCEGESYTWPYNGTTYGPFMTVGTDTVTNAANIYDTLIVSIHAEPSITMLPIETICDDENQIRLPFTVTNGSPNLFEVTINGQSFSYAQGSTDTILLSRPASIPAGTYTATITVRDSLVSCFSTTQTSFTIAQADVMYRKWDDLIFIDNSDNLYTSYQWYENGTELSQETNQYLYNPGGLTGLYYCRMTTTTGDIIYTCEQAFDDIPRSRDFTNGATQNITVSPTYVRANGTITIRQTADMNLHITLFDATGKMLGQHTQVSAEDVISAPLSEGIYFVRVQYGEDVKTTKIIVHE